MTSDVKDRAQKCHPDFGTAGFPAFDVSGFRDTWLSRVAIVLRGRQRGHPWFGHHSKSRFRDRWIPRFQRFELSRHLALARGHCSFGAGSSTHPWFGHHPKSRFRDHRVSRFQCFELSRHLVLARSHCLGAAARPTLVWASPRGPDFGITGFPAFNASVFRDIASAHGAACPFLGLSQWPAARRPDFGVTGFPAIAVSVFRGIAWGPQRGLSFWAQLGHPGFRPFAGVVCDDVFRDIPLSVLPDFVVSWSRVLPEVAGNSSRPPLDPSWVCLVSRFQGKASAPLARKRDYNVPCLLAIGKSGFRARA